MEDDEKDAFYVVRKGDIIGIYRSLSECQSQATSSMLNPSLTVYKGHGLSKEAEEYLTLHGLKNSSLTISASQVKDGIFGSLLVCPFQLPTSSNAKTSIEGSHVHQKPSQVSAGGKTAKDLGSTSFLRNSSIKTNNFDSSAASHMVSSASPNAGDSASFLTNPPTKRSKLDDFVKSQAISSICESCIIEFDGASKGNPGLAGAGAILRSENGSMVVRLREGVGFATNNVAEYRAVILGLRYALKEGFQHALVRGDSMLVCKQIQGQWRTKNANMAQLCKVATELKNKFASFKIEHIPREFNSDADAQANQAITLKGGEVQMDRVK